MDLHKNNDNDIEEAKKDDDHGESDSELTRNFNKFQLLESDFELPSEDNSNSDSDVEQCQSTKQHHNDNTNNQKKTNKNRRQKSRRKQQKKSKTNINSSEKEFDIELGSQTQSKHPEKDVTNPIIKENNLLKIDLRNLNPEAEIKRIFGKNILKEDGNHGSRIQHRGTLQRSRFVPSFNVELFKSNQIGSLARMELDDLFNDTTGCSNANSSKEIHFRYVHDTEYQRVHSDFMLAVQQGVSELIVRNYSEYPLHVESLVKLSDMMRLSENFKDATMIIEQALLVLERGFHPKFNPASGNCRLSYKRPENRTLFITLFKHITCLNRRGLRRTPLEYSKFLLSLNPENDPLFAVLLLDYYAIRSEEFDFFIDLVSKWSHLSKLPSFNLSLALAYFLKSRSTRLNKDDCKSLSKQADEQLQLGLLRYPNFMVHLLDAWSAEPEGSLKKCDYFNYTIFGNRYKTVPECVDLLVCLYVHRTCPLWKAKHVMEWLEKNVEIMVDKFASKELLDEGINLEYWSSFQGPVPRNLLRHVILSELPVKLPASVSGVTTLDVDPFPPESILSYNLKTNPISQASSSSSSFGLAELVLRSILPNFSHQPNNHDESVLVQEQLAELEADQVGLMNSFINYMTNNLRRTESDNEEPDHQNEEENP